MIVRHQRRENAHVVAVNGSHPLLENLNRTHGNSLTPGRSRHPLPAPPPPADFVEVAAAFAPPSSNSSRPRPIDCSPPTRPPVLCRQRNPSTSTPWCKCSVRPSSWKAHGGEALAIGGIAVLRVKQRVIFAYFYRKYESADSVVSLRKSLEA